MSPSVYRALAELLFFINKRVTQQDMSHFVGVTLEKKKNKKFCESPTVQWSPILGGSLLKRRKTKSSAYNQIESHMLYIRWRNYSSKESSSERKLFNYASRNVKKSSMSISNLGLSQIFLFFIHTRVTQLGQVTIGLSGSRRTFCFASLQE